MRTAIIAQTARPRRRRLFRKGKGSAAHHAEAGSRKVLLIMTNRADIRLHGPYSSLGAFPINHSTQE